MLKRAKGKKDIDEFELTEDMELYSKKERQIIINRVFKERYAEVDASIFLNKKDINYLKEKSKNIDSIIKWMFMEKEVIVNLRRYLLSMCIRQEEDDLYIHSISSKEI